VSSSSPSNDPSGPPASLQQNDGSVPVFPWQHWPRFYFAFMACILIATATAKTLSLRMQPALSAAPDPVLPFLPVSTLQWLAIGAESALGILLIVGSNPRRNAISLLGLGLGIIGCAIAGSLGVLAWTQTHSLNSRS
jgi:hypothetical protein